MRKILYFIFLLSFLAVACHMPSFVSKPTPVMETTVLPIEPLQNTAFPTFTSTVEVQPTAQEVEGLRTFTPAPEAPGPPNEIKFAANGTYTDVTDTIEFGTSKTYSLNAMKGQIMSISIFPQIPDGGWGYVPMQIKGADGNILCPQSTDFECLFWRGALPSSQDYFIKLTPNGDVPKFIMRVAIDPPGKDVQYFQYNNPATGISLTYPDTFVPAIPVVGNYKSQPQLALHFIDSNIYDKTNLGEVYLFVSSTADAQVVATCTEPNQNGGGPEQVVGNEVVNGYTFVHSTSQGAGAGNYYQQEVYRMVRKNVCYEVIYFIHYSNIENYTPGTIAEFDRDALIQKLFSIFSTLSIK